MTESVKHYDTAQALRSVIVKMADLAWSRHTNPALSVDVRRLNLAKWTAYMEVYNQLGKEIDDDCVDNRDNWTLDRRE